ncbi:MAG: glycosyltransferase [Pseudomonadota bacterium]
MRIYGHCRFSWFGISDTGRDITDLETARNILWHPERMAVRFHLFETIMLPSIRAQTDADFFLYLIVSEDMPQVYHDRLAMLTRTTPMVRILRTAERDIARALRPALDGSLEMAPKALHFRIDDDDALCSTYIARLRNIVERAELDPGTAISFPKGVAGFFHDGKAKHTEFYKTYVAAGLAFVVGDGYHRNPFQVQHRKVGQRQPSFVDPTFHAFQVTLHTVNNTRGYKHIVHDHTRRSRGTERLLRNNPDVAEGAIVPAGLDPDIDRAFQFTDARGLRTALQQVLDARRLATSFGFL